ncbi:MAG: hypothetical protein E6K70_06245 [Planctomycetota bacterium]|nr:MAG: hypothetical protein E6K70_06245 [Planctomycetota bacterium]
MAKHFDDTDFGSSKALLAHIKERSDDLEKVVIIPPGSRRVYRSRTEAVVGEWQMMLCMIGDKRSVIGQVDARMLLCDGILDRMGIKIEMLGEDA